MDSPHWDEKNRDDKKKRQIGIDFQVVSKDILLLKNNYMEREREKEFSMSKEEEKQARLGNTS